MRATVSARPPLPAVHTKDHPRVVLVFGSKERPEVGKVLARDISTDNTAVPTRIVVDVDDGVRSRVENTLNEGVICRQVGLVQRS